MKENILIFDVESTDLHGEAFAVGAVVADLKGHIIEKFALMSTDIAEKANDWVKENVLPHLQPGPSLPLCKTGEELRKRFYEFYMKHKDTCTIWSDVNFPVETNFLSAIVKDDPEARQWNMPYPLYDVANFVNVDLDRTETGKGTGMRKHHPLDDALSSYYCLIDSPNFKGVPTK